MQLLSTWPQLREQAVEREVEGATAMLTRQISVLAK